MSTTADLLVALSAILVSGCSDACGNKVIGEFVSPRSDLKAIVFERDCGATTGFSTQVSILKSAERLSGSGNAFVLDEGQTLDGWNGPWVRVVWLGPRRLEIQYDATARTFEKDTSVEGVTIDYRPAKVAS